MSYKAKRTHKMRLKAPIYIAVGKGGDQGWAHRRKRLALAEASLRSIGRKEKWRVMRYGSRSQY